MKARTTSHRKLLGMKVPWMLKSKDYINYVDVNNKLLRNPIIANMVIQIFKRITLVMYEWRLPTAARRRRRPGGEVATHCACIKPHFGWKSQYSVTSCDVFLVKARPILFQRPLLSALYVRARRYVTHNVGYFWLDSQKSLASEPPRAPSP